MSDKVIRHYSRPYGDCREDRRLYFGGTWPWQQGPECVITPPVIAGEFILDVAGLDVTPTISNGYNMVYMSPVSSDYGTSILFWLITSSPGVTPFERTLIEDIHMHDVGVWYDHADNIVPLSGSNLILTRYLSGLPVNSIVAIGIGYTSSSSMYEVPTTDINILSTDVVTAISAVGPQLVEGAHYGILTEAIDVHSEFIYLTGEDGINTFMCLNIPNPAVNSCVWTIEANYILAPS